jgi:hypothetical protein
VKPELFSLPEIWFRALPEFGSRQECPILEIAMTEIARRENRSNPSRRRVVLAVAAACVLFATRSEGFAFDGPVFRGGRWKFERKLQTDGKPTDRLQISGLLIDRSNDPLCQPDWRAAVGIRAIWSLQYQGSSEGK